MEAMDELCTIQFKVTGHTHPQSHPIPFLLHLLSLFLL